MSGRNSRMRRVGAAALTAIIPSSSDGSTPSSAPAAPNPALLTSTSTSTACDRTSSMSRSTSAGRSRSPATASTLALVPRSSTAAASSRAASRATSMSGCPAAAKSRASSRPMPLDAPVMSTAPRSARPIGGRLLTVERRAGVGRENPADAEPDQGAAERREKSEESGGGVGLRGKGDVCPEYEHDLVRMRNSEPRGYRERDDPRRAQYRRDERHAAEIEGRTTEVAGAEVPDSEHSTDRESRGDRREAHGGKVLPLARPVDPPPPRHDEPVGTTAGVSYPRGRRENRGPGRRWHWNKVTPAIDSGARYRMASAARCCTRGFCGPGIR